MPTNEKLPPGGYELAPGWTLIMGISNWGCSWRWHHRSGIEDCNTVAVYGHSTKDRAHPDWMAGSCAAVQAERKRLTVLIESAMTAMNGCVTLKEALATLAKLVEDINKGPR